ncbi:MAG: pyridoxal phosphate-dependent aminotransferase [Thermodesulfobacteriota bacterium]
MAVSNKILGFMEKASWIRKMFEEGGRLKQIHGPDKVFDFSLGNPNLEPVKRVKDAIAGAAADSTPGVHAYMPNAGYPAVRQAVAEKIKEDEGVAITGDHVIMTTGAGGALNIIFKTVLNPGDEIVVPSPFFVEYLFYPDNHGGKAVTVKTRDDFSLDLQAIEDAITPKTAAVLINSPNNPTGKVYSEQAIQGLGSLLERKSSEIGRTIVLISDEPYRGITYDGVKVPSIFKAYSASIVATSFSKDLSLPGERLGYAAVNPAMEDVGTVMDGLVLCNRILGYVNAPALIQRAVKHVLRDLVDVGVYKRRRDTLYNSLTSFGYECVKPEGAFYLFPKSPIPDDVAFVGLLQQKLILTVPGTGFGGPGYFRIAYCVSDETIAGSLKGFEEAIKECR